GHGKVEEDGIGYFAFEDEHGRTDSRPVEQLANEIFRGSETRCVFLNACQTTRSAVAGLAQHLVQAGVPHVLGWAASVGDDLATEFATQFYTRLVRGEALGPAAAHAREAIRRSGRRQIGEQEAQDATYALSQLYSGLAEDDVLDRKAK